MWLLSHILMCCFENHSWCSEQCSWLWSSAEWIRMEISLKDLLSNLNIWKIEVSVSCLWMTLPLWIKQVVCCECGIHEVLVSVQEKPLSGRYWLSSLWNILYLRTFFLIYIYSFLRCLLCAVLMVLVVIMIHRKPAKEPGKSFGCLHSWCTN